MTHGKKKKKLCPVCKQTREVHGEGKRCQSCANRINRARPVVLVNLKTGELESAAAVADFCRNHPELGINAKYHFSEVLHGRRLHHKNWALPETPEKYLRLKDIYGNKYEGTVRDLVIRYKVPHRRLWKLMTGGKKVFQGLMLEDTQIEFVPPKPFKVIGYKFETPNGGTVTGKSLRSVANQLNGAVTYRSLGLAANGYYEGVRGYKIKEIDVMRKSALV